MALTPEERDIAVDMTAAEIANRYMENPDALGLGTSLYVLWTPENT